MTEDKNKSSFRGNHALGIPGVLAVAVLVQYFYRTHMIGPEASQAGQWQLGLGLVGGILVLGLIIFPFRRRLRQGPAKELEPWMITHAYVSLAAGIILLHHGYFNLALDLRGVLLALLWVTIVLGIVLLFLRSRKTGVETSKTFLKLSTYHRVLAVLTGILLVVHVFFDAVIRQ
ncbi:MAG: hypothetical protein PHX83_03910 [Acidobacteriia bacterium]|nr:hypothetical protein [Terriglobia bacterium]